MFQAVQLRLKAPHVLAQMVLFGSLISATRVCRVLSLQRGHRLAVTAPLVRFLELGHLRVFHALSELLQILEAPLVNVRRGTTGRLIHAPSVQLASILKLGRRVVVHVGLVLSVTRHSQLVLAPLVTKEHG